MNIGEITGLLKLRDEFSSVLNRAADNVNRVGDRLGRALDRPVKHSQLQVAALAAGATLLVKKVFDATAEAQAAMAQLEAGVVSTGGAAGRSAAQLEVMAGKLQRLTGIDDEVIQGGQALLLVYRRIGKDAFEPTLQAALNLSARGFGPLETTAKMVGKAMNDPIKGVTTLERQLGKFDPAVKATIKSLMEHGRIAEAQGIILEEVDKKVGGAAEAFRNTLPGAISALKGAWENLFEKVGETAGSGGAFQTSINSMVRTLNYLEDNWHEIEAAIFLVLGDISSEILKAAAKWVEGFEKVARAAQRFQNLVPDFFGFGLAGKSQKIADNAVKKSGAIKKELLQLADDLKSGFEQKAADAIAAGIAPVKGLDKGMQGLDDTIGGLSDKARKLAEDLGDLRAELLLDIQQTREMTAAVISGDPAAIANLERTHALHRAYLQDVDKFGRKAADGLAALRRSGADAKQELDLFKELDQKWNDFVEEVTKKSRTINEDAAREMEDSVRAIFNASFVDWTDFNDKVKAAIQARADERIDLESEVWSATATGFQKAIVYARAWQADLAKRIQSAVDRGVLSAKQGHEEILKSRQALAKAEKEILTQEVGSALNSLGQLVAKLDQQLGSLLGSIGSALGASADFSSNKSWAGLFSAAGAWWTAFVELANFINRGSKGVQWSTTVGQMGSGVGVTSAGTNVSATNLGRYQELAAKGRQLGETISKTINDLLLSLGASIDKFADFRIWEEKGLVLVQFEGQFKQWFANVEEALSFAIAEALRSSQIRGLDPAIVTALKNTTAKTLEELQEQLKVAFDYSRLGVDETALALRDLFTQAMSGARAVEELGLSVDRWIKEGFGRDAASLRAELTGQGENAAERQARRIAAFNEEITRLANEYNRLLPLYSAEVAALRESIALKLAELKVTRLVTEADQLALIVDQERLRFLMGEIASLTALLASLPKPILPGEVKIPRGDAGGGKDQLRDFIEQRGFELDLSGLSEYARRIAEIGREYALQLEQAGRDIKLRQQLIDLKERELALLAKEQKESLAGRFREFLGLVTPFDQVRETAAQLIKDIEESPFGDERKARMIGRVLDDLERQIEQLAQESALSLFSQLSQDLEKFGADEAMMSEVRRNMAIIEHTLKLAHYRTEIAILKAQGVLSDSVLNTLQGALNFLDRIDPTKLLKILEGPRFKGYDDAPINETVNKIKDAIDSATRTLEDMEREALNPLVRDLLELQDKFKPIYEALGHVARVEDAYASQLKLIMQRHFGAINDLLDSLETSDLSPLRTIDQFGISLSKFRNTISAISTGDFAKLEEVPDLVQTLLALTKQVRPLGSQGYRDVFEEIQSSLRQLASIANLPAGVLTQLSSGIGLGNLLLPNQFAAVNQPLAAADVSTPIVNVIGKHSDRQILVLNSMDARLGAIQSSTEVLVSISESTNSVLSQVR